MSTIRRGIHTIEVQAPIVAAVGVWLASAAHYVPPRYAVYVTMASSVCIAVARGLAKLGDPRLNNNWHAPSAPNTAPTTGSPPPTT